MATILETIKNNTEELLREPKFISSIKVLLGTHKGVEIQLTIERDKRNFMDDDEDAGDQKVCQKDIKALFKNVGKIGAVILCLFLATGNAHAGERWVEYHQFIKEDDARRAKQFVTVDNPQWTREDMLIRRAMTSGSAKLERKDERVILAKNIDEKEYIFKGEEAEVAAIREQRSEFEQAVYEINHPNMYKGKK